MKKRLHFLDNLRTFMIFLVVVIHSGIVYESVLENTWIVVDPYRNESLGLIRMYLDTFVMFTLFFISGYFVPRSLKSKTASAFIQSKFNRILLPWIIAVMTMIPLYKAIFLYSRGLPQEEWYSYFHIFSRTGGNPFFFADNPVQNWLWFLPILFTFQMVYLVLSRLALPWERVSIRSGVLVTLIVGLGYSMLISNLDLTGWYHSALFHFQRERLLPYFLVFLLGALSFKQGSFESNIRNTKRYIGANIGLTISLGIFTVAALNLFFNMVNPDRNFYFISASVDRMIYYFTLLTSMLSFLYIWIYTFRFYFNKTNKLMQTLNKNSYFVYIIHVVVIGIVATFMLPVSLPAIAKFGVVTILAFILSNLLVTIYRVGLEKHLSSRWIKYSILLMAAALTIAVCAKQNSNRSSDESASTHMIRDSIPPSVGLHEAILGDNLDIVKQHIQFGSDLNIQDPGSGNTPLHTAAVFGKTEIAEQLIEAGANMDLKNNDGSTPLITAAFFCRKGIVAILLKNGADRTIQNNQGSTALSAVSGPFAEVRPVYQYFDKTLSPLGLKLDFEYIEETRPIIANILQ